jgi:hypothetical protein
MQRKLDYIHEEVRVLKEILAALTRSVQVTSAFATSPS